MATIGGYNFPEELFYHTEHSWARKEADGKVRIGMNDMFQGTAGNIVYVDLPFEGDEVEQDEVCGKIQSRKWIGKLVAPISGEIVEVNEELEGDPALINNDPYGEGWIVLIEPSNLDEDLKKLMHGEGKIAPWLKAELDKAKKLEEEKKE